MNQGQRCETQGQHASLLARQPIIIQLLYGQGRLVDEQLAHLTAQQKERDVAIESLVIEEGFASSDEIASIYAEHFAMPYEPLDDKVIDEALVKGEEETEAQLKALAALLPDTFCWEHRLAVLRQEGDELHIAIADPSDVSVLGEIRIYTGLEVVPFVAPLDKIERRLQILFGERDFLKEIVQESGSAGDTDEEATGAKTIVDLSAKLVGSENQVVRLVNQILLGAYRDQASDIHIEPTEDQVAIRYRIDGRLTETTPVPRQLVVPLISRLKVISKLDIAEKRVPQDGAFTARVDDDEFDVRVSTVPVVWGEKMVMRLLNKGNVTMEFSSLGFNEKQQNDMCAGVSYHNGLVFVTGPTGSGKSTTLYTALSYINDVTKNIMTAEDPVEYKFSGINQVHIRHKVGLTFASVLRSFLRQDPDVIMVGEVRDNETAEICMRAALTGHLVLSTLHTNSALDAIARLSDMGTPPFLIAATLRLIEAQRLARRLCKACKRPVEAEQHIAQVFGFEPGTIIYQAEGCEECRGAGYRGRVGLYEVIPVSSKLSSAIAGSASFDEMEAICIEEQIQLLCQSAVEKVLTGETSVEEIWQFAKGGGAH